MDLHSLASSKNLRYDHRVSYDAKLWWFDDLCTRYICQRHAPFPYDKI